MKKRISILLLLMILVGVVSGCGGNKSGGETIKIQYGLVSADNHSSTRAAKKFAEYVNETSNGELLVEVYPNSVLGGDVQMTEAVALGTIQMALPATSTLVMYSDKFGALDMPFMFDDVDTAFEALNNGGEVGKILDEELGKVGILNLGYNFNGKRSTTNNVRPINEPADFKGVKMRVMESPIFIDMFSLLGTNPTPISFGELFTALQQGTVDGQENAASLTYDSKFQEVQKYFSATEHVYSFCANLINEDFYNSLSEEHQKILGDGANQFLCEWQIEEESGSNEDYILKLEESGMEVNRITPENLQKFKDAVAPMYDKYKTEIGEDVFEALEKYVSK